MNSNNKKKLKNYLSLAGGITTAFSSANAQVVYTDVNPDYLLTGNNNTYSLDLNNDGVEDYSVINIDTIQSYMSGSYSYKAVIKGAALRNPVLSNSWLINSSASFYEPTPLNQGDTIGSSGMFGSYSSSLGAPIVANFEYSYLLNGTLQFDFFSTFKSSLYFSTIPFIALLSNSPINLLFFCLTILALLGTPSIDI